ncbi:ABC transporter substrate-binding protein [Microbacterium sp. JAI119]|uniref:ABC transporter substrate-binding protein n=1 Tax=Microbacterium sp. JAI119 TaxID=2723062 RepID=UPI0015CE09F2|nr:ABC transporter substrate-binding protein [Microbacterium sp. JAI119]NYF28074.1 putative hydroxymethylpyrimidine transport system substrate-binding protein [Microbacterium sp. JAI119]
MTRVTTGQSRRRILRAAAAVGAVAVVGGLAACSAETDEPGDDDALTSIRFVQEWPVPDGFWIPWVVAKDQGFYEDAGLDVDIMTPPNVAATMQYLGTDEADIAFTTSVDIVTARSQGVPVVGIGAYGTSNNWGLMSKTSEPIDPADLEGKLVGTYNDAWSNAQLSMMLASVGKTISDVTLVTADSSTVPLLVEDQVDVITGITNAEGSELESLGVTDYSIAYSKDFGAPDAPVLMLAANEEWLSDNTEAAQSFMEATIKGLNYARNNPEEAIQIFMDTYPDAQTLEFTQLQWDATAALFGEEGEEVTAANLEQSAEVWQNLVDVSVEFDLIDEAIRVEELFTNEALKK